MSFFTKWHFEKFINEWKLRNYMEIMLWKPSACIKRKFYCYEDFTEPLAFFLVSKTINRKNKEIKISCIKFLYSM